MTVESNYAIAIATLRDWFKNLAPVYQPMKKKTETIRLARVIFFPRFEQVTWNCTNLDWFIAQFAPVITLYLFYDTQLKTALNAAVSFCLRTGVYAAACLVRETVQILFTFSRVLFQTTSQLLGRDLQQTSCNAI